MTKRVAVDYGERKVEIEVPDSATVVEYADPPLLDDPEASVANALAHPFGSAPLVELARPGMKVAIGFDDVTRPALPARLILPQVVNELKRAGVNDRDIVLVNGCSNHRKNTRSELANHLGPEIFNRFWPIGAIRNHDCDLPEGLRFTGITASGRYVEHNRDFLDADLQIYQGNVSAQGWKGYTGTGVVIGLASTRSIASHHSFNTVPMPEKKKEHQKSTGAKLPGMKPEMTAFLEEATGKKTFYVNAVTGTGGRPAGIFAGHATAVTPPAWELAGRMFTREAPQADVLVVGLGAQYSYGTSNNTLIAAVGATVPPRYSPDAPVLREGGVVIAISPTNGFIDGERFPSYQDLIDVYARHHNVRALVDHEETFHGNAQYLQQYRHGFGYPALHAFWIFYELEYALQRAGAVIMAGTTNPGAFRTLGLQTAANFDDAWKMARRYVGANPTTVVAPTFWSRPRIKFSVKA
ncbi:MAG: lactate racemase domain-containing protein [Usitatibacter sp.]